MTTREHLNHLCRRTGWLWLAVIILAVAIYCSFSYLPFGIGLVALFLMVIIGIVTSLIERASGLCLHCRKPILRRVGHVDCLPRGIPAEVRFCPLCGVSLDLPAPETAIAPTTPASEPRT